jgi:hypothetical protein
VERQKYETEEMPFSHEDSHFREKQMKELSKVARAKNMPAALPE